MSGSGISWAIYKSAPRSRQITMPAPHHSVFTGRMPFLSPNQQCQSTEGITSKQMTSQIGSAVWLLSNKQTGRPMSKMNDSVFSGWASSVGSQHDATHICCWVWAAGITAINSMPAGRHRCCQSMGQRDREWTGGHPTFLRAASIRDSVITAGSYLI